MVTLVQDGPGKQDLADYIREQIGEDGDHGSLLALNLTRAEWLQCARALRVDEQWQNRKAQFLKEKVPMAACQRLLNVQTDALANLFRPDIAKAKKALHELVARALVQLDLLGD